MTGLAIDPIPIIDIKIPKDVPLSCFWNNCIIITITLDWIAAEPIPCNDLNNISVISISDLPAKVTNIPKIIKPIRYIFLLL